MLGYAALTLVMMIIWWDQLVNPVGMLVGRAEAVATTLALWGLYRWRPCRLSMLIRVAGLMAWLGWWYPDTYELNRVLPNLDHLFAQAEQWTFGCQPALVLLQRYGQPVVSELLSLGYVSYYPLIITLVFFYFFRRYERFTYAVYVVMASFFIFYVVFDLLPVAGPQFYFHAPGVDAANGVFPFVDDWFRTHTELSANYSGPFSYLVYLLHGSETPIAAFPSSHVGASTVILLLTFRLKKNWGYIMLPFYVLLCLSTVYIGAHYAIDVFAGWISALIFLFISRKLYKSKLFHRPDGFDNLHRFGHHHRKHHHHRHHR